MLDLSGTNSVHLQNLSIYGHPGLPPKVGILTSRTKEAGRYGIAPNLEWFNVRTWGSFSGSGVVSLANEVSSFLQCAFENNHKSTTAFAYMNAQNSAAVISRIGAIKSVSTLPKPGKSRSNIIHSYDQVRMLRPARFNTPIKHISQTNPAIVTVSNPRALLHGDLSEGDSVWFYHIRGPNDLSFTVQTVADPNPDNGTFTLRGYDNRKGAKFISGTVQNQTGPAMLFSGAHDVNIENGYALTYGNHSVVFDLVNGGPPRSFRMHMQCEHSPKSPILIEHKKSRTVWQGATIHLSNNGQVNIDSIVDDTGTGTIVFQDLKLKVNVMGRSPTHGVFRNPDRFDLRGCEITVPRAAALNSPRSFKNADAIFEAYDRPRSRHDWRKTEHFGLRNEGAFAATLETASSADLADAKALINARFKRAGKMVFDTNAGKPVFAVGPKASDTWNNAMGMPLHKPA